MCNTADGYKLSIEVLLNLNHDRYKSYFTQFIVLHFGVFTVYNSEQLEYLTPYISVVGIILAIVWFLTLRVIIADIKQLWKLIEEYEGNHTQSININESRASKKLERFESSNKLKRVIATPMRLVQKLGSGKLMLSVPILFFIVHLIIWKYYKMGCVPN